MKSVKRFSELDLLRGLAVIGMVVFHFFYLLDYFGIFESDMFSGWWHVLGQFVRFSFLGLVGVGMAISYNREVSGAIFRQWRRALIVFLAALLVSFVTFMVIPQQYVKFGILHLIAVSIFVLSFVVRWRYLALAIGLVSIFVWQWLGGLGATDSFFLFVLGVRSKSIFSIDYFPIFPWISLVCFGIFIGQVLYVDGESGWRSKVGGGLVRVLAGGFGAGRRGAGWMRAGWRGAGWRGAVRLLGRHSLVIYLLHVPVIWGALWIISTLLSG